MRIHFEENASPEIRKAAQENYIVVVPLGCIEQHGPHLPVGCDYGRPTGAVERAQEKHGVKVLVLPTLPFGPAAEHTSYPGTISLTFSTWSKVILEILENLVRDGFRRIVITKGCGGHLGIEGPVYEYFCQTRRRLGDLDLRVYEPEWGETAQKLIADSGIGHPAEVHAGGVETSLALAGDKREFVHLDRLRKPPQQRRSWHGCWWIMEDLSETGATGDPTRYDAEWGKRLGHHLTEQLADFLGEMWRSGPVHSLPNQ